MQNKIKHNVEEQDIESLIVLLEKWLELICQMQVIQDNLSHIPEDIGKLKLYSNGKEDRDCFDSQVKIILASLSAQLPNLFDLEERINDSIALKEIIEALQQKSKNKDNLSYELSFQRTQLNRRISKIRQSDKPNGIASLRDLSSSNKFKHKVASYWNRNSAKISLGMGIFTIACYGWFVHLGNEPNIERDTKNVEVLDYIAVKDCIKTS